jgi:hypothetical protein
MKKFFALLLSVLVVSTAFSQDSTKRSLVPAVKRPNDHFMLQIGYAGLTGRPDSVRTKGFSRFFNFYFMLNKPFKTNPKLSAAFGAGIGSNNYYFDNVNADVKAVRVAMPFTIADSMNHFKKYKLTTISVEVPVELRWVANPADPDQSFKFAVGAKVGTILKAYSKGKDYVTKAGTSIYDQKYIQKEYSKRFFNGTNLAVSARVGYGHFTLTGQYQITSYLKETAGAPMKPYYIGLTISGL